MSIVHVFLKSLNAISVPHCKSQGLIIKKERKREGDLGVLGCAIQTSSNPHPRSLFSVAQARIENGFRSAPTLASVNGREDGGNATVSSPFFYFYLQTQLIQMENEVRFKTKSHHITPPTPPLKR